MNSAAPASDLVVFRVNASDSQVRIGDRVTPNTVIGHDLDTDRLIRAGCHGRVSSVHFSGADHALVVVVNAASEALLFKVDASHFDLRPGTAVTPETVIGRHLESHKPVKAGLHGLILSVHFSGADHSLLVVIEPTPSGDKANQRPLPRDPA